MKAKLILIMFMMFSVFLVGCSNTDTNQNEEVQNEETKSSNNIMGLIDEIKESMTPKKNVQYNVKYVMDYGDGQKTDMDIYFKGDATFESSYKQRIDMASAGFTTRIYADELSSTMCTQSGTEWSCFKTTEITENPSENVDFDVEEYYEELGDHYKLYKDGTFTIDGTTVPCYTSEVEGEKSKYCISKEGVMLYFESDGSEGLVIFKAESYSNFVSDSVFELPEGVEVVDMNSELDAITQDMGNVDDFKQDLLEGCYIDCEYLAPNELSGCMGECDSVYG